MGKVEIFLKQYFRKKFQKFSSLNMTPIARAFTKREKILKNILNYRQRFHIVLDEYHNK